MRLHRFRCLVLLLLLNSIVPAPVLGQASARSPLPSSPPQPLAQANDPRQAEATRLLQAGVKQYSASQFDAATQSFEQALQLYRALNDRPGQWFALYFLGILHTSIRDFTKGTDYLQQSWELARSLGDRIKQSDTLVALGNAATGVGDLAKAVSYAEQNLTLVRQIPDLDREAKALNTLIQLHQTLGQAAKARDYQQQLTALIGQSGVPQSPDKDARAEGIQAIQAGQRLQQQGTRLALEQSIQQFQTALALAQKHPDSQLQALALLSLSGSYADLGQHPQAIAMATQALQLVREKQQTPLLAATALISLGASYRSLGELQKALDAYNQALPILEQAGDRAGQATVLNNTGTVLLTLGRYQSAFDFYNRSLALSKQTGDRSRQAKSLNNLGLTYADLGLYQQALDHYNQALSLLRDLQEGQGLEASVLHNLGVVYVFLGQRPKALTYFQQALTLLKDTGDRAQQAYTLSDLGTVYSYEDNRKAIDYYNQALELARTAGNRDVEAVVLGNLGQAYVELGQADRAGTYYTQALALARSIGSRTSEASTLSQLSTAAYAMKDYPKAIQLLQQGLALIQPVGDRRIEGLILRGLGKSLLAANQPGAAEAQLRESARVMESIRAGLGSNDLNKVSIFEEQSLTYRLLQQALVAQHKDEAALEVAERGRARAFVEQLAQHDSGSAQAPTVTPPAIEQIRQIAKTQNATLVEYSILNNELDRVGTQPAQATTLLIWVVQPTGSVTLRQVTLRQFSKALSLEDLVSQMRQSVGVRGLAIVADAGTLGPNQRSEAQTSQLQQLYRLLIQPIADLLPTDPQAQVIFIPQGPLFMVPFAALQNASGQYLIEQHTLRIAPAIQVLDLTHQRRQALQESGSPQALVVGNPTMPQVQLAAGEAALPLPSLPGAEREARTIAALLQTQALTGDAASKTAVLKQMLNADLIHLATHGLLNDFKGLGLPGAIALAPDRGSRANNSGLLTADEILDLKLKARLVVLSACDTGRGQITGDGVIGLSRSFITAGVPSIVVSLWSVADAPTAALMTEFYQALKQNPDQAQALRQAMLTTLKQYPEPRNWAAFTLIGEAR